MICGGKSLGADLVVESYSKIEYITCLWAKEQRWRRLWVVDPAHPDSEILTRPDIYAVISSRKHFD